MNDQTNDRADVITPLLADDHPVTREGLALILSTEQDMEVVAQAGDGEQAVVQRKHQPKVTILDLQMARLNGLGATTQSLAEFPNAKILLLPLMTVMKILIERCMLALEGTFSRTLPRTDSVARFGRLLLEADICRHW